MVDSTEKIRLHLKRWQERLIDTSGRNPLLCFNSARSARLQVASPSAAELFERVRSMRMRSVDHINADELEIAILHVVERAFSIQRTTLPGEVARKLGVQRVFPEVADRIRAIVDSLIDDGKLLDHGPNVSLN